MRSVLVTCALAVGLVACGEDAATIAAKKAALDLSAREAEVKEAVKALLRDPESAQFQGFAMKRFSERSESYKQNARKYSGDKEENSIDACIFYNAKNGFGGYGGWKKAILTKENLTAKWHVFGMDLEKKGDQCLTF